MKGLAAKIAASAALATACPVFAERPVSVTGTAKRIALQAFARCSLERNRDLSIDFALNTGTPQGEEKDYSELASYECAEIAQADFMSLRVSNIGFSGAVAEELLRGRDLAEVDALIANAPNLVRVDEPTMASYRSGRGWSRARFARELPRMHAEWMLDIIGDCTVRRSPATTRAIFQTAPDSTEESAAISAVIPLVAACLPSAELRITPDQLRLSLASNYLRLAAAAAPAFRESIA